MSKHTPEPWITDPDVMDQAVLGSDDVLTADCCICDLVQEKRTSEICEANAARIVACVNSLAGIKDPTAFLKQIGEFLDDYGCMCKDSGELCPACVVRASMGAKS